MAIKRVRKIFKRVFIILNCIITVFFLIACLSPYLNPSTWWFMGFLGIAFPYMASLLFLLIFFWLILKPIYSLLPIFTLLVGWKQFEVLFAINKYQAFNDKKDSANIRILDWNIRSLEGISNKAYKKRSDRAAIPESILEQNADIICLQEFNNSIRQNNIDPIRTKYPYYYFSKDFERKNIGYQAGIIIFSKYPIIDTGKIRYPGTSSESLIFADIQTPKKIIRVFSTHLQSFKFKKEDYEGLEQIKNTEEKAIPASKTLFQKMKLANTIRSEQAIIVRKELDKSPYPTLICGDFNDVPNSFTYFHVRKDWQDAFLHTSLGIGRTYLGIAPTLRIDYMFVDNNFYVKQFDLVDVVLSDHLMLLADIGFK